MRDEGLLVDILLGAASWCRLLGSTPDDNQWVGNLAEVFSLSGRGRGWRISSLRCAGRLHQELLGCRHERKQFKLAINICLGWA